MFTCKACFNAVELVLLKIKISHLIKILSDLNVSVYGSLMPERCPKDILYRYLGYTRSIHWILCTYWLSGRAGRENIWLEVRMFRPSVRSVHPDWEPNISRPARPDSVNKHFIMWPFLLSCSFSFGGTRARTWLHCFVSRAFSKSQWFHAIHLVSQWSVLAPQVVYKLQIQISWQTFQANASILAKCHRNCFILNCFIYGSYDNMKCSSVELHICMFSLFSV